MASEGSSAAGSGVPAARVAPRAEEAPAAPSPPACSPVSFWLPAASEPRGRSPRSPRSRSKVCARPRPGRPQGRRCPCRCVFRPASGRRRGLRPFLASEPPGGRTPVNSRRGRLPRRRLRVRPAATVCGWKDHARVPCGSLLKSRLGSCHDPVPTAPAHDWASSGPAVPGERRAGRGRRLRRRRNPSTGDRQGSAPGTRRRAVARGKPERPGSGTTVQELRRPWSADRAQGRQRRRCRHSFTHAAEDSSDPGPIWYSQLVPGHGRFVGCSFREVRDHRDADHAFGVCGFGLVVADEAAVHHDPAEASLDASSARSAAELILKRSVNTAVTGGCTGGAPAPDVAGGRAVPGLSTR